MKKSLNKEIAERKRSENALQQYRNRLEELMEERTAELKKTNIRLQREIKERKRAEEQILRQKKVLEAINKVLRETLICETDFEIAETCLKEAEALTDSRCGFIAYVNPTFVEIFGYTLKDIPNGREWFMKANPDPVYREQVISNWLHYMKKAKVGVASPYTWSVTCKDGSEKVIRFIAVTMETGDQFVIYEDLTEQKKLENQFLQSQKMEGIGRLAGGVAHDFNNLLTTIIGYTQLMLMQVDQKSPLRSDMEEIKKASDRAANLTRQLLAFSRKQIIRPVVLNINHAIAEMDKMLHRLIRENIDPVTILEPELWKVKFDPGQMDQVVMNLAVNARDAMPEGGKLTIETANVELDEAYARRHGVELKAGPFVMFAVSDTGIGMDDKTQFFGKPEDRCTGMSE